MNLVGRPNALATLAARYHSEFTSDNARPQRHLSRTQRRTAPPRARSPSPPQTSSRPKMLDGEPSRLSSDAQCPVNSSSGDVSRARALIPATTSAGLPRVARLSRSNRARAVASAATKRDGGRGPPLAGRRSRRSSLWAFEATAGGVDGFVGVVECGRDRLLVGECGPGGLGAAPCV